MVEGVNVDIVDSRIRRYSLGAFLTAGFTKTMALMAEVLKTRIVVLFAQKLAHGYTFGTLLGARIKGRILRHSHGRQSSWSSTEAVGVRP